MEDAPIAEVLAQLRGVGVVFNNAALGSLAQLHAATQIAILEKIRDYVCNPSVLLMCFIELEQTSYGLRKQSLAHTKTPSVAAGAGLERGQPRPQSWPHVSTSSNALPRSYATHIIRLDEPCTAPAKSYLMCQPGLGGGACPQVGRACHAGAAGPYDVEYALSLCGGGIVYLTVRGLRDVESFPWELPAGWYALHAAPYGVLEPLQLKVPGAGIAIPPNLPTGCIVALVKLGNPKRSEDFDGKQWALGRWRRQGCAYVAKLRRLANGCAPASVDHARSNTVSSAGLYPRCQWQACVGSCMPLECCGECCGPACLLARAGKDRGAWRLDYWAVSSSLQEATAGVPFARILPICAAVSRGPLAEALSALPGPGLPFG